MIVAFLLAATASGCSRKAPTLVEVGGKVTNGKEPIAGVVVIFIPVEDTRGVARGVTGEDGQFLLTHESERPGAEPGEYKVVFRVFERSPRPRCTGRALPASSDPSTTPHCATVTAGGATLVFDLGHK